MDSKTSQMAHGQGEDKQQGPHLAEILPHDDGKEMMDHKSSDPARGNLNVHEFSSSVLKDNYESVLGNPNRRGEK